MYPTTIFDLIDNSDIESATLPVETEVDRPVFSQVFIAPKGPEEWQVGIMGREFLDLYGSKPSFVKYGQPLLQATSLAIAGAKLNTKRIVHDDAELANILVYAEVSRKTMKKYDSGGNNLYYDTTGGITTNSFLANDSTTGVVYGSFDQNEIANTGQSPDYVTETVCKITLNAVNESFGTWGRTLREVKTKIKKKILNDVAKYPASEAIGVVGIEDDLDNSFNVDPLSAGAVYPLFLITDNGRGESNKSFRIYVDETSRRPVDYIRYIIEIYEGSTRLEQMAFSLNTDQIEQGVNVNIENVITTKSKQVRCNVFENSTKTFIEQISAITGMTYADVVSSDLLIGTTGKLGTELYASDTYAEPIPSIIIENAGGIALNSKVGITLAGGNDAGYTGYTTYDRLLSETSLATDMSKAFTEENEDIIYDLDNFRVDVIFDANYPQIVKQSIAEYVNFRDDVFYFRDMGTGLETLEEIDNVMLGYRDDPESYKRDYSRAIADYHNSWDIIDPYSKKRITVTATYNMALLFVDHWINGKSRPFCGFRYDILMPDVIDGTVNFVPKKTPSRDQKQEIDDKRINYASYYQGNLTMNTEYTSQKRYTQLSWINNVLSVMWLIKTIRIRCPKIRYAFFNGANSEADSLEKYIEDVQSVITQNAPNFATITLSYEANNVYENNKIFYACIDVKMKNFIQSERFKITVLKS